MWTFKQSVDFTLGNSLFGTVKLTKNVDFDKYKYSGYGIGFDAHGSFLLSDGSGFGKFVSACWYLKKYVLRLGKGPMQRLDDTTLAAK